MGGVTRSKVKVNVLAITIRKIIIIVHNKNNCLTVFWVH